MAFAWKDYRHESRRKVMRLEGEEFVRRFLLHVLPTGFQLKAHGISFARVRAKGCASAIVVEIALAGIPDRFAHLKGLHVRPRPPGE